MADELVSDDSGSLLDYFPFVISRFSFLKQAALILAIAKCLYDRPNDRDHDRFDHAAEPFPRPIRTPKFGWKDAVPDVVIEIFEMALPPGECVGRQCFEAEPDQPGIYVLDDRHHLRPGRKERSRRVEFHGEGADFLARRTCEVAAEGPVITSPRGGIRKSECREEKGLIGGVRLAANTLDCGDRGLGHGFYLCLIASVDVFAVFVLINPSLSIPGPVGEVHVRCRRLIYIITP